MATEMSVQRRDAQRSEGASGEGAARANADADREPGHEHSRRGLISINRSPLARKIITFNLLSILILVVGVLLLNPFRNPLVLQREASLVNEAALLTSTFEAQLLQNPDARFGSGLDAEATLRLVKLNPSSDAFVFDRNQRIIATTQDLPDRPAIDVAGLSTDARRTPITNALDRVRTTLSGPLSTQSPEVSEAESHNLSEALVARAFRGETGRETNVVRDGTGVFAVASPILREGRIIGVVGLTSGAGEIDRLVRPEHEQILQMFVIVILVSIGLSLVLASTIANPLSDLAAAAEIGRDKNTRTVKPSRIRIPDLSDRPDEIGRLSGALRGMVAALYDRIDANEKFAADVAHEIKNPLASLRSAVGSLRFVKKADQRDTLLNVIDHDVRRLDRLVTDISNASRLDSELVKEDDECFDLVTMLGDLSAHLGRDAREKRVEFIADLPDGPIIINGLESRLAQVFVNLVTNAISFCRDGDAIRIWTRRRENRVLVVVEDTGPGIPESALNNIFNRFYSERPEDQFGNNSGLGLAISKQIVEAHGGVIWAENIEPAETGPMGARFVVGLPV